MVAAAPPQHGKSESVKHAIVYWMGRMPRMRFAYATYSQDQAEYVSQRTQQLAEEAGLEPQGNLQTWRVANGAEVLFTSPNGPFAGRGVDGVLVVDDPYKDRRSAESPRTRRLTLEWFDDVARKRVHPGGSIALMSTRWHVEDLSGVLISRGWRYLNFKAIAEGSTGAEGRVIDDPQLRHVGEPLWPERRPLEFYDEHKSDVYSWYSLYQGEPRPRGGAVFSGESGLPARYNELPASAYRVGYGVDLAYTARTHADFSVLIELWRVEDRDPKRPLFYVVRVDRKQVDAPSFTLTLKARLSERRGTMRWYAGGTEKGSADFIRRQGIPLDVRAPKGDKFVRAQPVAAAWNDGRVLVPEEAPWLSAFLDEVLNFTGVADLHDDQIDALAAGFDSLNSPAIANAYSSARAHRGGMPKPRD
jgi:phage terminase large subunit-like protein